MDRLPGLFLLGSESETSEVAAAMSDEPFAVREFRDLEPFMEEILSNPPCGVLVWDTLPAGELEAALETSGESTSADVAEATSEAYR